MSRAWGATLAPGMPRRPWMAESGECSEQKITAAAMDDRSHTRCPQSLMLSSSHFLQTE